MAATNPTPRTRAAAELGVLAFGLTALAGVIAHLPADTATAPLPAKLATGAAANHDLTADFPNFNLYQTAPYSLVTDAPAVVAQETLATLTALRQEFHRHFADLIRTQAPELPVHVVFFSHEADYRAYVLRAAPGLVNSAGLFLPRDNRLVLLDQLGSHNYLRAQQHAPVTARAQASVRLAGEARAITARLIRHEGTHQLMHATGFESAFAVAPTWLTEGLAQYCETETIGAPDKLLTARLAPPLLPLRQLLNHRQPAGFFALPETQVATAYAQSWALIHFLMQPEYRPGFFAFIRSYRDVTAAGAAQRARLVEPAAVLVQHLHTDFATLENQWHNFIAAVKSAPCADDLP
ncbi:MAG: hypothetical protein PCFJNLEI_01566 [Verrucomicrobiae bacterium]|nr:hypothetical protein [Verrucomicrobiae bacterium]